MDEARVRSPHPVQRSGSASRSTYRRAFSSSTMPDHRACPGLVVSESIGVPSPSRPSTNQPRRSQNTSLNRSLSALPGGGVAGGVTDPTAAGPRRPGGRRTRSPAPPPGRAARRKGAVGEGDAVPRVLPALVRQSAGIASAIVDEPSPWSGPAHDPVDARPIAGATAKRLCRAHATATPRRPGRRRAGWRRPCRSSGSGTRTGRSRRACAARGGCAGLLLRAGSSAALESARLARTPRRGSRRMAGSSRLSAGSRGRTAS